MSADSEDEDMGVIAWPGFVDILSSVIIMFIFFLLVVAAALYFHTIIYVSKIESDKIAEQVESEFEFLFKQEQTEFAESEDQDILIDRKNNTIVVFFGTDAISVISEIKEKIESELGHYDTAKYTVKITAPRAKESTNITQRKVAIARMFNLRNTVLDFGFAKETAIPKLVETAEINDTVEWAKIELIKK